MANQLYLQDFEDRLQKELLQIGTGILEAVKSMRQDYQVGVKNLTKGVKVDIIGQDVTIDLSLMLDYGYNIPTTCGKVQEKVKSTVENMTGLNVTDVNVRIASVDMNKQK